MIFRTLREAQWAAPSFASWKQTVIVRVAVKGREFFRTYTFDATRHKCKRCRNARPAKQFRVAATGHTCTICGNPFAAFVREGRGQRNGAWTTFDDCWSSTGRLH
jgi:hypothetical protein